MQKPEASASHLWLKKSGFQVRLKTIPPAHKWFGLSVVLLALFLLYTAIFLTGVLLFPTLHWEAPHSPAWRVHQTLVSANTPFTLDKTANQYGYPGGHAIRWMFLGLILSWLVWRHVRRRLLRRLLLVITLAIAFGGGLLLVYTGSHLATDLLAGYLIGASAACCAIGLLTQNEARRKPPQLKEAAPQ